MKAILVLVIALCIWSSPIAAQRASDVLERGITIKQNQKLFLRYDAGTLKYDIAQDNPDNFLTLPDSTIFLAKNIGVNVYIKPLNPLNFSCSNELTFIPDPIEAKAVEVLGQIFNVFKKADNVNLRSNYPASAKTKSLSQACQAKLDSIEKMYNAIRKLLGNGAQNQKTCISTFNTLKNLTFEEPKSTGEVLIVVKKVLDSTGNQFKDIKGKLDSLRLLVKQYNCNEFENTLILNTVFSSIISQFTQEYNIQFGRYKNLNKSYDLVKKTYDTAIKNQECNEWCIFLKEVTVERGKISKLAIKINQAGYVVTDSGEIVENKQLEKVIRIISFRKFNLFIPEVSAGVAYTNLNFPKYSTETDAQGNLVVADAGNENFKQLSISAMLNIIGFIPNSMLHPFFQIGVGINANYPTLLTGIGLRLNFVPLKRLALAFGYASTWIQQLDKLKVGDKVSGEADVSKDLKYQFNWPPKPYIAIQYNF